MCVVAPAVSPARCGAGRQTVGAKYAHL
eukprot:COSAG06_NODE_5915_length_3212_cov_3.384195_7_plen_27_part_01